MRICIPDIIGRRGAGLGNELFGWAKAYLASRVLGARLLRPAWGLNQRGYRHYFHSSRFDWMYQAAVKAVLPVFRMSAADFEDAYDRDFREVVIQYAERNGLFERRSFVLTVGGMWGGRGILREAYPYLRKELLHARATAENLTDLEMRLEPDVLRIALHVRRGDFLPPEAGRAGTGQARINTALPLDWYLAVCRSLTQQLSVPHRFLLFSDGSPGELAPLMAEILPLTTSHQHMNVCSDLLAMAQSDLLITSTSSFSLWAAALSNHPYIWHRDNLVTEDGSWGIWDHGRPLSHRKADHPRGVVVGEDGQVDGALIDHLEAVQTRRGWGNDLVFYGRLER